MWIWVNKFSQISFNLVKKRTHNYTFPFSEPQKGPTGDCHCSLGNFSYTVRTSSVQVDLDDEELDRNIYGINECYIANLNLLRKKLNMVEITENKEEYSLPENLIITIPKEVRSTPSLRIIDFDKDAEPIPDTPIESNIFLEVNHNESDVYLGSSINSSTRSQGFYKIEKQELVKQGSPCSWSANLSENLMNFQCSSRYLSSAEEKHNLESAELTPRTLEIPPKRVCLRSGNSYREFDMSEENSPKEGDFKVNNIESLKIKALKAELLNKKSHIAVSKNKRSQNLKPRKAESLNEVSSDAYSNDINLHNMYPPNINSFDIESNIIEESDISYGINQRRNMLPPEGFLKTMSTQVYWNENEKILENDYEKESIGSRGKSIEIEETDVSEHSSAMKLCSDCRSRLLVPDTTPTESYVKDVNIIKTENENGVSKKNDMFFKERMKPIGDRLNEGKEAIFKMTAINLEENNKTQEESCRLRKTEHDTKKESPESCLSDSLTCSHYVSNEEEIIDLKQNENNYINVTNAEQKQIKSKQERRTKKAIFKPYIESQNSTQRCLPEEEEPEENIRPQKSGKGKFMKKKTFKIKSKVNNNIKDEKNKISTKVRSQRRKCVQKLKIPAIKQKRRSKENVIRDNVEGKNDKKQKKEATDHIKDVDERKTIEKNEGKEINRNESKIFEEKGDKLNKKVNNTEEENMICGKEMVKCEENKVIEKEEIKERKRQSLTEKEESNSWYLSTYKNKENSTKGNDVAFKPKSANFTLSRHPFSSAKCKSVSSLREMTTEQTINKDINLLSDQSPSCNSEKESTCKEFSSPTSSPLVLGLDLPSSILEDSSPSARNLEPNILIIDDKKKKVRKKKKRKPSICFDEVMSDGSSYLYNKYRLNTPVITSNSTATYIISPMFSTDMSEVDKSLDKESITSKKSYVSKCSKISSTTTTFDEEIKTMSPNMNENKNFPKASVQSFMSKIVDADLKQNMTEVNALYESGDNPEIRTADSFKEVASSLIEVKFIKKPTKQAKELVNQFLSTPTRNSSRERPTSATDRKNILTHRTPQNIDISYYSMPSPEESQEEIVALKDEDSVNSSRNNLCCFCLKISWIKRKKDVERLDSKYDVNIKIFF